jgi:hypothetical protein
MNVIKRSITSTVIPDIEELHTQACKLNKMFYIDPSTQYKVMTRYSHEKRGKCCGNGCRHCPYGDVNTSSTK